MNLDEFYATVGGDLDGVRGRLITDERISKFLGMFFEDPTYQSLVDAMAADDLQTAFRAAHTLKGTGRDLGMIAISEPASELADALRPDESGDPAAPEQAPDLLKQVQQAYDFAISAFQAM